MAHSCPDCGQMCYCGGDIDDMCTDDTPQQERCIHNEQDTCDAEVVDDDESTEG